MARINKVLFFTNEGQKVAETASQQVPEDPFGGYYERGLVKPPYDLERLVFLAESHPVHGASLEQKATDVIGVGWEWVPLEGLKDETGAPIEADENQRVEVSDWFESLAGDEATMQELLNAVALDFETVGQGYLEVARDPQDVVRQVFHVPAHTVRWHRDGQKLVQERAGRMAWFRRWGVKDAVGQDLPWIDERRGYVTEDVTKRANEILVFRKTSRRSSWYGIPNWISALGWITLSIAARDYNILFFENHREARWAVILTNIEDDPKLLDEIEQAFKTSLADPHRNLFIPVVGDGQITFQRLSNDNIDLSFDKLDSKCDDKILVAHRVPGDRIGLSKVGSLGGNIAGVANEVYVEAVVAPTQELFAARINRFIEVEFFERQGIEPQWRWAPKSVDLTEEVTDLNVSVTAFMRGVSTLNEARSKLGLAPLPNEDTRGTQFFWELVPPNGAPPPTDGSQPPAEDTVEQRLREHEEKLLETFRLLQE